MTRYILNSKCSVRGEHRVQPNLLEVRRAASINLTRLTGNSIAARQGAHADGTDQNHSIGANDVMLFKNTTIKSLLDCSAATHYAVATPSPPQSSV